MMDFSESDFEDALEQAFWEADALRKRKEFPMSERDAFKAGFRGALRAAGIIPSVPEVECGEETPES